MFQGKLQWAISKLNAPDVVEIGGQARKPAFSRFKPSYNIGEETYRENPSIYATRDSAHTAELIRMGSLDDKGLMMKSGDRAPKSEYDDGDKKIPIPIIQRVLEEKDTARDGSIA